MEKNTNGFPILLGRVFPRHKYFCGWLWGHGSWYTEPYYGCPFPWIGGQCQRHRAHGHQLPPAHTWFCAGRWAETFACSPPLPVRKGWLWDRGSIYRAGLCISPWGIVRAILGGNNQIHNHWGWPTDRRKPQFCQNDWHLCFKDECSFTSLGNKDQKETSYL